jgi:hypothetical protein
MDEKGALDSFYKENIDKYWELYGLDAINHLISDCMQKWLDERRKEEFEKWKEERRTM